MDLTILFQKYKKPKAIFVDLDGTLADSLSFLFETYRSFLSGFQKEGTREEFNRLIGPSLEEIIITLKRIYQLEVADQELLYQYQTLLKERYISTVSLKKDCQSFLEMVSLLSIPLVLVTSASASLATAFLEKHHISSYFTHIVSPEGLRESKPDPAIYRKALQVISLPAEDVWVIEDSLSGIQAAIEASIPTLKFGPGHERSQEALITPTWVDVQTLLQNFFEHDFEFFQSQPQLYTLEWSEPASFAHLEQQVEQIWLRAHQQNPSLFNGWILRYLRQEQERIWGEWTPYKYYYVQQYNIELKNTLEICPISVSGVVRTSNHVLVAKRAAWVTQYPSHYELVPSGGIDRSQEHPQEALLSSSIALEFLEEAGLTQEDVTKQACQIAVRDRLAFHLELIAEIFVKEELLHKSFPVGEYTDFQWLSLDQVSSFLEEKKNEIVPLSKALLKLCTF